MPIKSEITYLLNDDQRKVVAHQQGPLLIIAGPGSGKTRSLLLLALNLLLQGDAKPSELVLCTYTDKAAYEMQDHLRKFAGEVGYHGDLSHVRIGTIHSICKRLMNENLHFLPTIQNDFETLSQLDQQLLVFEYLDTICTPNSKRFFLECWGALWKVAKELCTWFDKIAEELLFDKMKKRFAGVSVSTLRNEKEILAYFLTDSYKKYQKILSQRNCLDFSHILKCTYNLLKDPEKAPYLIHGIRYVFVDEYQDTNYIQEQILTLMAAATETNNLFVVGDEDQALYRFRGATVRNILEFEQKNPGCKRISLLDNYRSHKAIINTYNRWMTTIDWSNPQGDVPFRTDKQVRPGSTNKSKDYTAVCTIKGISIDDEAEQFAELVITLKEQGKIEDYSQVALLLRSVRADYSAPYIQALEKVNVPAFCPRARSYFAGEAVCLMIGSFMRILRYQARSADSDSMDAFWDYLAECKGKLQQAVLLSPYLLKMIRNIEEEIENNDEEIKQKGKTLLDYFYRLITANPFLSYIRAQKDYNEELHSLEMFSQLLSSFQRYRKHMRLTASNVNTVANHFFEKFLCFLYEDGLNQHEDAQQHFPLGLVPILTIHQSKGLEFPVVVVGRMDKLATYSDSQKYTALRSFSDQSQFEPDRLIPAFDQHRLYYVAFSRAKRLLVLSVTKHIPPALSSIWQSLPAWKHADITHMPYQNEPATYFVPLPRYGLTSHIRSYQTCPRCFEFFRFYKFAPGQPQRYFFGQLVHQTLEHIHRLSRDNLFATLNEQVISAVFERKFNALKQSDHSPLSDDQKVSALRQVMRYVEQNEVELQNVEAAELPVQLNHKKYILTGKVDLLVKMPDGLTLIDFKTHSRIAEDNVSLQQYKQQLYFYAHALEKTNQQRPTRLCLYWTAEEQKENALVEIVYDAKDIVAMNEEVQDIVASIQQRKFHVRRPPAFSTCRRCDLLHMCKQDYVI